VLAYPNPNRPVINTLTYDSPQGHVEVRSIDRTERVTVRCGGGRIEYYTFRRQFDGKWGLAQTALVERDGASPRTRLFDPPVPVPLPRPEHARHLLPGTDGEILALIRDAVEAALQRDPEDWAAAGAAAEAVSQGRYQEVPRLVDLVAGDGRSVSAGVFGDVPVAIGTDGRVRTLDLVEVRFRDLSTDEGDAELYPSRNWAEDAAAYWRGQGYRVETFDLTDPEDLRRAAQGSESHYRDLGLRI